MHDASPTPIPIRNNELQQCGVVSPVGKREERRHTMFHTVWLTAWLTALPMKTNGGGTCDGEKGPADVRSGPSEGRGQRQPNNQHPSDCDNARRGPPKLR